MIRRHILLLAFILALGSLVKAQEGHELEPLGQFDFLKKHPGSGHYILDSVEKIHIGSRGIRFDSTIKIHFLSTAFFSGTRFHNRANFSKAQFDSTVNFSSAQFNSEAYYSRAHFRSYTYFSATRFNLSANFSSTKFDSSAHFFLAQFDSSANFSGAQFHSKADFSGVQFGTRVDFSNAHFKEKVNFLATTLPDTLIFRNLDTSEIIDLTTTHLDSTKKAEGRFCMIELRGAPLDRLKLYYDKFRIYWPSSIDRTEYEKLTQVYEGLLKKFKSEGYLTSYATLDQEYQAFKDIQNPDAKTVKKFLNKVNFVWNNYGYNKEWIWLWTFGLLFISTLINWLAFPYLIKKVYPVPMIETALFDGKSWKRNQFKGVVHLHPKFFLYSLYYTILIFFGLKLTTERINFKMHGGIAIIFTEYLIGLICLGYLANFIISSGLIGK